VDDGSTNGTAEAIRAYATSEAGWLAGPKTYNSTQAAPRLSAPSLEKASYIDRMSEDRITLLLANYNNGQYLRQCLDSVGAQKSEHWNCIILDDASTDHSSEVYAEYAHEPRIRVEHNTNNLGLIRTQKKLIAMAETDIVGILDPDDALGPDAVEQILAAYKAHPEAGFVYSNFWYCDSDLNRGKPGFSRSIAPSSSCLDEDCVSHFKTFRRSAYYETSGHDESMLYAEDKDLILKLEEVTPMVYVDALLYFYRVLPESQSHGFKRKTSRRNHAHARRLARSRRMTRGIPMSLKQRVLHFIDRFSS